MGGSARKREADVVQSSIREIEVLFDLETAGSNCRSATAR